jgi:hypothetical protein
MLKKLLSLFGLGRNRATLIVTAPPGRQSCGGLVALDAEGRDLLGGSISVAVRADDALARGHGNPSRDVARPYGDPPCGTYVLIAIDSLAGAPESLREEIGNWQLLFEPSEGDAARAESGGRLLLGLHAGRLGEDNRLRASAGGLRMSNGDLETLHRVLSGQDGWRLELREETPRMLASLLSSEPAGAGVDPPIPFSAEARRAIERRGSSSGSDDDSWRSRDDDWRSSRDRDSYSSSGPAVAAAAGAAAGVAAAKAAEAKGGVEEAEEHEVRVMDSGGEGADGGSGSTASADSASGTSY